MGSTAVVVVSGGDAVSPFTTPTDACSIGLAAGNTDTAIREYLLNQGHEVFTSPAMNARGPVVDQLGGFGKFGGMPFELPAHLTVNSTGDIDLAGEHLARFLGYLGDTYGVTQLHLVAHSMGGLFSRAAISVLKATESPLSVASLTTLGTPWNGSLVGDFVVGDATLQDCAGDPATERVVTEFRKRADELPVGAAQQVTARYLGGPDGWNEAQKGVLDDIPVTLIGGSYLHAAGENRYWPHDGFVSEWSALATDVSTEVLAHRTTHSFPLTHSIFTSDLLGLPWETAMTWNSEVLELVHTAITAAR
ncbi:triacylglycerol lipase [Microbacteriaceae bacterium SG_E_30_P1]|uniref:Triacylglycerol lipase n=1 Tax=Antiquaquibacter oligotrophicus TaxID=2880260 RepID=A0ABT6KM03_9MICO|nr:alpha/beta fold hydrolase [Antiquaquibacter oligotrophicus]MDH6180473.1 triacylglycerol lipase [Antiquaquibacter oligotrophicus]UDF13789.1 alpha/beta hydrolase [Antiquaquibacter oligotrophicus]